MSLAQLLIDSFSGSSCSSGDLLQQFALLHWLNKQDESSKAFLSQITKLRIANTLWNEVSQSQQIEAVRAQTIMNISDYVKKNPKASKADLTQYVAKEIQLFAQKVESM